MFDIGWSELLIIGIVALIAIGPKELPGVLRTVGQYMGKVRRMASEFQGQFQEAMREAEMSDLKQQVDEMTDTAKSFTNYDPMEDIRKEVDSFTADPLGEHAAASTAAPAPVSPDAPVPQTAPDADIAIAPEVPGLKTEPKAGSGA